MRLGRFRITKELLEHPDMNHVVILNMFRNLGMVPIKIRQPPLNPEFYLEYLCISENFPMNTEFNLDTDFEDVPEFIILIDNTTKYKDGETIFQLKPVHVEETCQIKKNNTTQ